MHRFIERPPDSGKWLVAVAGFMVMLMIGTLYSWGIFTQPLLVAFHWHLTTTTCAYAIANLSLAAGGAVVGGFWQDRVGPRRVAMTGMALWGAGNLLTGLGTVTFGAPWLYLTYGVVSGLGAGMAYVTPLAAVSKWFPEQRGLVGGLVVGGFGLGTFFYNQWIPRLSGFHAAAVLRDPPPGYGAGCDRSELSLCASAGCSPAEVVRMQQFYLLWLQLFANAFTGVAIISNAVFILTDLTDLPAATIAPLFGLVSIFNAIGRFFWGGMADRIGCERTFAIMFAVQAATLFGLSDVHGLAGALVGISVILLCCGGGFGIMPAYCAQYFGTRYMGRNYGLVLSAWGFAGLLGPLLAARMKDVSGSFAATMPLMGMILCAAVMLPFVVRKPVAKVQNVSITS